MRVFKKISTPFIESKPDKAIIIVNAVDPQINTIKSFIQACHDNKISLTVFVNKIDRVDKSKAQQIKDNLGLLDINYGSSKTSEGIPKMKTYLELWKGKRIAVLGVFNSGKTSFINVLCGTTYKVGDIPGTTVEFTETKMKNGTVVIDSVGQLIDIHKPLMISVDLCGCSTLEEKFDMVFEEEIKGLIQTKEYLKSNIKNVKETIDIIRNYIENGSKIITVGAGASALVAEEIAGQATECGIPCLVFTNNGSQIQPVTFSKGLGESEGGISRYIGNAINKNDIVIGVSASGGTGFVFDTLRIAKEKGAITIAITENSDTPLGKYAKYIIKSEAKPEGPSSSKIQTAHLVIGHAIILTLADELKVDANTSVGFMLPEPIENKKMGIK